MVARKEIALAIPQIIMHKRLNTSGVIGCLIHGGSGVDTEIETQRTKAIVQSWPYRVEMGHINLTVRPYKISVASGTHEICMVENVGEGVR